MSSKRTSVPKVAPTEVANDEESDEEEACLEIPSASSDTHRYRLPTTVLSVHMPGPYSDEVEGDVPAMDAKMLDEWREREDRLLTVDDMNNVVSALIKWDGLNYESG